MSEPREKFNIPARVLHWTVAGLVLLQIPLAYVMIAQPVSPGKLGNYALHKSVGVTIFTLTALRLAWRAVSSRPAHPSRSSNAERMLAQFNHGCLYLITLAMPLAGWLNSSAANFPVSVFGLLTLPNLVPPDAAWQQRFELIHRGLAYGLFALLTLHLLAAGYHHLFRRDNVLISMLPLVRLR